MARPILAAVATVGLGLGIFMWDEPGPRPRRKLGKDERFEVWKKYIGAKKAEGPCYVCGRTIHQQDFDVGHNVAHAKGGTSNIANFRPICRQCNRAMGTMTIETYKKKLEGPAVRSKQAPAAKKKAAPARRPAQRRPRNMIEEVFGWD